MKSYNPSEIEPKWQQVWAETKLYKAVNGDTTRQKYYMLTEFPYPSGEGLHAGHAREYTLGDVMARYRRMRGHNVLFPMGYDAFGLPTENYAIKHHIKPQEATAKNVATFEKQQVSLGLSFDWDRKFNTSDPDYYRWTQWLFLRFFNEGLAYQAELPINWCPKEKTGLANEEVVNGVHERCGTPVEKKLLKQWVLKITAYADRLIDGLKTVDFPPRIADQQINWIGRSEGAEIDFQVSDEKITVFTTRPDTLAGATFLVLAPEHPAVKKLTKPEHQKAVDEYISAAQRETDLNREEDRPKTGVFTGEYATNPISGAKMPIWVADYVLINYGTGAIMAVPAHDARDREFAEGFNLPIVEVIESPGSSSDAVFTGDGKLINSEQFNGLSGTEAKRAITKWLYDQGTGKGSTKFRLHDWIFSRQHYWGEPIPIIHCPSCGAVAVPDDQLPVQLPEVEHYEPTDTGQSPLSAVSDWVNVTCPKCDGPAKRETDTMPNWAGSSWYWLRYMDPENDSEFASKHAMEYWGEVDMYLGGMEHTTLHLLYSRFWHQFLFDQKLVPTPEPYAARRGQGIVLAGDGRKMSKSLGNVIDPSDVIARYGADAFRLYVMFMAPYDETTPWSDERLNGVSRFLHRTWNLCQKLIANTEQVTGASEIGTGELETTVDRATHKTLKKVHSDLEEMHFNTMVSTLMEYVNFLNEPSNLSRLTKPEFSKLAKRTVVHLIQMLAPSAPHISEELWHEAGNEESVHISPWPEFDPTLIKDELLTIVIQVNGRLRSEIQIPSATTDDQLKQLAAIDPKIAPHLHGHKIIKTIVVPRRLVNFVVK